MHNEKVEEEYCSLVGKKKIIIIIVNALLGGCSSASVILFLFLCYTAIAGILVCSANAKGETGERPNERGTQNRI